MKRQKVFNITLTAGIFTAFVLLGIFVFRTSYFRAFEALIDLYGGLRYYFRTLFGLPIDTLPSVTEYSRVFTWNTFLPTDFNEFKTNAAMYFGAFVSKENFLLWLSATGKVCGDISKVLILILPCVVVGILVIKRLYATPNTSHNEDTKPLRIYKKLSAVTYLPIKQFVCGYIKFIRQHAWICKLWIAIWVFHLNLASVIIAFFAYYFYFAVSFDVGSVYTQVVKLVIDLQVIVKNVPVWVLLPIAWFIFEHWRKKMALNKLRRFEARNCGFINELPIVSMTCGSMGKKKTTIITDMALSQEVMFRQKALDILQKTDMKFPYFPWICFEKELQKCLEYKTVYNLATVKAWVEKKRKRFEKHGNTDLQLYGYDTGRYALTYKDGLKTYDIFDVLSTYAQAYFIYVIESSLIVSNYSVRTDNLLMDEGNFPMWVLDFFSENERQSRFSHILDFDVLRLGKKVLDNNPKAGSFEFGVVAITEIGKERGNVLDHKEIKKNTDETNQKNDLFNSWLKMCRHSATVDNFPFIKVFTDEQRPESWGSDARDLCDIIHIVSAGEQRLALPFYTIEEMLTE